MSLNTMTVITLECLLQHTEQNNLLLAAGCITTGRDWESHSVDAQLAQRRPGLAGVGRHYK